MMSISKHLDSIGWWSWSTLGSIEIDSTRYNRRCWYSFSRTWYGPCFPACNLSLSNVHHFLILVNLMLVVLTLYANVITWVHVAASEEASVLNRILKGCTCWPSIVKRRCYGVHVVLISILHIVSDHRIGYWLPIAKLALIHLNWNLSLIKFELFFITS